MQKQNTTTIILVIVTVLSFHLLLTGQLSVAQLDNLTQSSSNTDINIISPGVQTLNQNITDISQNNSNIANIMFENSRLCNLEDKVVHCVLAENITGSLNNVILDGSIQSTLPSISTSFRVNEINDTASNNVAIVYSLIDEPAEKYAGINIFNNGVYTVFYSFESGVVNADPDWPGQLTDLTWTPGALFNMSVVNQNDSVDLVLNGTTYYSQPINEVYSNPGYVGLYYDYIDNIDFYSFKNMTQSTSTVTQDTETILLEGHDLPEESYIHLYDSKPYEITSGHIAAKVPCNDDNSTDIIFLIGQAPELNPVELEFISPLSISGEICLYHGDVISTLNNTITDIAIQNNSTEDDIEFPETSSIVISVNEISKLTSE
ncbi:hypothetical protein BH23THE1_BH23THE1_34850 [soil metagenome]